MNRYNAFSRKKLPKILWKSTYRRKQTKCDVKRLCKIIFNGLRMKWTWK